MPGFKNGRGGYPNPVVAGKIGEQQAAVVAASRLGAGRIVAFGHDGFTGKQALQTADTGRLMLNAVAWASQGSKHDELSVGVRKNKELLQFLRDNGVKAEPLDGRDWVSKLSQCSVLFSGQHGLGDNEIAAIRKFVRNGGGLIAGGLGWGWLQLNPGKDIRQHPLNRALGDAGILWADGTFKRTSEHGYDAATRPYALCQASFALKWLFSKGQRVIVSRAETAQAIRTLTAAVRTLPVDDELLLPKIRRISLARTAALVPSEKKPITLEQPWDRLLLTLDVEEVNRRPIEKLEPHPAAAEFPGAPREGALRVTRTISVDPSIRGRHSTGMYAAAGERITIRVKGDVDAVKALKLKARIGAHSDRLWHKDKWSRVPEISRTFDLVQEETVVGNAFGGLIYIEVSKPGQGEPIAVEIGGAIEAPYYRLGETSCDDWRERVRDLPAPWAELATSKIVLTVPSETVRELNDPEALMRFWDEVADAAADLATLPRKRDRPQGYVADVQISAGYMHAGHPIMTHLDAAEVVVDRDRMMKLGHHGVWGLFHEMGHNHQNPDWTFSGTGEVTCNLFTLYVIDTVLGIKPHEQERYSPEEIATEFKAHREAGAPFGVWKSKPFLALLMYVQLQRAFGWESYKKVFAEYRALSKDERPKNDAEERDQWMVRFSRTVDRNLAPFFDAWGVPVSAAAKSEIADLPDWPRGEWE